MSNTPRTDTQSFNAVFADPTDPALKPEAVQAVVEASFARSMEAALRALLAEPHGCVFCDSGKLRNPDKGHEDDCGFALAAAALSGGA